MFTAHYVKKGGLYMKEEFIMWQSGDQKEIVTVELKHIAYNEYIELKSEVIRLSTGESESNDVVSLPSEEFLKVARWIIDKHDLIK